MARDTLVGSRATGERKHRSSSSARAQCTALEKRLVVEVNVLMIPIAYVRVTYSCTRAHFQLALLARCVALVR